MLAALGSQSTILSHQYEGMFVTREEKWYFFHPFNEPCYLGLAFFLEFGHVASCSGLINVKGELVSWPSPVLVWESALS